MLFRLTLLAFFAAVPADAYIWPSPQLDALESVRFDQQGFNFDFFAGFIQTCADSLNGENTGRSTVADWIRTVTLTPRMWPTHRIISVQAYHDMATHNASDGTGGLDGSIRFAEEQARAENAGDGFANTIPVVVATANRYVSIADSIALAAIIAIESCGGPEIAFRGGRLDAGEPNAPGVPEPEQGLDSHIASFARQGFTQTEMIGLVACGHTFGGVQHDPFPDIVGELNDPTSTEMWRILIQPSSPSTTIAKEYISGTTQNPLVVGANDTTNSDKRIFGSDGNVTMSSFANSLELYTSTCADLFARMLNTVPSDVQLTDVIAPLPVKPSNVELTMSDDTLKLFGQVRVLLDMTEDDTRTVRVLLDDNLGRTGNVTLTFTDTSSSTGGKYTAAWYTFNDTDPFGPISLNATAGLKSLRFVVDDRLEDQGRLGFAIQDSFMFSETTCRTPQGPFAGQLDVAVRNDVNPTRVYVEQVTTDSVQRPSIVELEIPRPAPAQHVAANPAYSLWSLNFTNSIGPFYIGGD
ncbi:heme peroxidase [Mycena leptocephala]|nr:heme peroxidase [Mycena leptocephala]